MAELVDPCDRIPEFDRDQYADFDAFMEEEEAAFKELQKEAPDSPEEGIEGAMIRFQVADGYAHYRVVNADPLQIQHVPFGDAYRIPDAHVRGLRKEDVVSQLESRRARSKL